jgi:hypothetical protein
MQMSEWLFTGVAAKRLGVTPKQIVDLFGRRQFPADKSFVTDGRRLIHESLLPLIKIELQRRPGRPRTEEPDTRGLTATS